MKRPLQGYYLPINSPGEKAKAFVPAPLPPAPPLEWSPKLLAAFGAAAGALGRLDGAYSLLPGAPLFLYSFLRKEAVLSCQLEGSQSSLADLFFYEADPQAAEHPADVRQVSNYLAALEHGLNSLAEGFPLSLRLMREMHAILLAGRERAYPGEFRRSQNWIGGARPGQALFVPPPAANVLECMGELEKFLNDIPLETPPLLKAGLAHVQFETIHPFLEGNGRMGRLLVTLIFSQQKVLREPLLYLSQYLMTNRRYYYALLKKVWNGGDWEGWLRFFADAVTATATHGLESMQKLADLAAADQRRLAGLGRSARSAEIIQARLLERPIASVGWLAEKTGLTRATLNKSLNHLKKLGIVYQLAEGKQNRLVAYGRYLQILQDD